MVKFTIVDFPKPTPLKGGRMNAFSKFGLAVAGSLVLASAVMAQGAPSPEANAVKARKAVFDVISLANAPVGAMLRGGTFDAAVAAKAGERLQVLGGIISDAFAKDTHGVAGLETKARDAIWTTKADFDAKAADLVKAAASLEAAGKAGNKDAVTAAAGAVGKACGACHDAFRDK